MPRELAERTARGWEEYKDAPAAHFAAQKLLLDQEDASYAE
jgi:hypothetical protein